MPKITDPGEYELMRKIYTDYKPEDDGLTSEERNERWETKNKNKTNQAR